jgi:predicted KAP-like P-loop ATPase
MANEADAAAPTAGDLLLRDLPADFTTDADAFGHDDYARTLSALLVSVKAPFTIGLFGPWGQGKSTVLERLKQHVSADVVVCHFDAWRHEGQAIRRHFLKTLAHDLTLQKQLPRRYVRRRLRLLDGDEMEPLRIAWTDRILDG